MDRLLDRKLYGALAAFVLTLVMYGCGSSVNGATVSPLTESPDGLSFRDSSSPLGFYSNGSIESAANLPDAGSGFLKVFRLRKRNFASASMVESIRVAAAKWRQEFPNGDRVQVGDITDWNGGSLSGHASHQNGLDADVAYLKANHIERNPDTNGPKGFEEQFVSGGRLTANFDVARNWAIIRNLVARGNVGRIFVDPIIKRAFCVQAATIDAKTPVAVRNEALRRLRPLTGHADHFHVRIKCPTGHPKCLAQTEPPTGTACGGVGAASSLAAENEVDTRSPEQISDDELGEDEG